MSKPELADLVDDEWRERAAALLIEMHDRQVEAEPLEEAS